MEFQESPVVPEMLDGRKIIRFECRKGISCWNACCSNIDIALTPYDILRLKEKLGITSSQFLEAYTYPYEMEKDGMAGVKLKPVENGTACRFMREEGCSVYSDRPTACRYYPIALLSMRKQDEYVDTTSYALVKEGHCLGHFEPREISIDEYRNEQGIPEYDEAARGWRQLVLKKKSSGPAIGKPSKRSLQLFFMTCYDIDRFRDFVSSASFNALYIIPDEERQSFNEDENLLQFGFRFLRQVFFGEESIAVRNEAAEERRKKVHDRRTRLEKEAAEQMARSEEGLYDDI